MVIQEKKTSMIKMKMGDLCEELVEDILSRIPFKQLTRMKCVSKDWCRVISHIRRSRPRVSLYGLIMFKTIWENTESKFKSVVKLFDVKDRGGELEYFENNVLLPSNEQYQFWIAPYYQYVQCCCFSNGLLLCKQNHRRSAFIYDSVLKQQQYLPSFDELCSNYDFRVEMGMGLAFDGIPNHHFKVVCFYFKMNVSYIIPELMDCMIFSSETGESRKHRARVVNYSSSNNMETYTASPIQALFVEESESLYWTFYQYHHMIVYNLQGNFFEIHDLPKKDQNLSRYTRHAMDECLWVSEGCLHYSYTDEDQDGIYVWTRVKGKKGDSNDEYHQDEVNLQTSFHTGHYKDWWKLKCIIDHKKLKAQHPDIFCNLNWQSYPHIRFSKPCAFNEVLQVLYLILPGNMVVSYSFETGRLSRVRTYISFIL